MDSVVRRKSWLVTKVNSDWNIDALPNQEMNINEELLLVDAAYAANLDTSGYENPEDEDQWLDFLSLFEADNPAKL